MNQFIAIMKEAYWSTLATKLLYFELAGVLLCLLLLTPFTISERVRFEVSDSEVKQGIGSLRYWTTAAQRPNDSAAKSLWQLLPADKQQELLNLTKEEASSGQAGRLNQKTDQAQSSLASALNYLITEIPLWDDPQWEERIENRQTLRLWERRSSLTPDYQKRLNRLLVQEAFRSQLSAPLESNAMLMYGSMEVRSLMTSGMGFEEVVRQWVPFWLDKLFLTVGILLAILVTAPMVPQMLEEGSLYLLLSKPVTRVFLLLSKYIGSGMLIAFVSGTFLTGFWLILGFRFNIWIAEILWCIPLAVVMYLVYYSVTVAVSLIFRNVILSIIGTILFASLCYSLSISRYFYGILVGFERTANVQFVGEHVFRRTAHNHLRQMNESTGTWDPSFMEYPANLPPEIADAFSVVQVVLRAPDPIWLPDKNVIVGETNFFGQSSRTRRMCVARPNVADDFREPKIVGTLPYGTLGFYLDSQSRLLTVTTFGAVYQLNEEGERKLAAAGKGDFTELEKPVEKNTDDDGPSADAEPSEESRTGISVVTAKPTRDTPTMWTPIGMVAYDGPPTAERVVFDPQTGDCLVLGRTTLTRAKRDATGKYQVELTVNLPWEWSVMTRSPICLLGRQLLIPLRSRELVVLDADTLRPVGEYRMPSPGIPLSISGNPAGTQAVVAYSRGDTWVYDAATSTYQQRRFVGDAATSATFKPNGNLLIAHDLDDVSEVDPGTGKIIRAFQAKKGIFRGAFDWGVDPIYKIFPKPNECYRVIEHLANDGNMDSLRFSSSSPDGASHEAMQGPPDDPWAPLRSSVIFATILMIFNVFYFWRQEF